MLESQSLFEYVLLTAVMHLPIIARYVDAVWGYSLTNQDLAF